MQLKEVQRQPLLEKRFPPYQCLPLLSPALALLSAWICQHSAGRAELEREARGAFRGKARECGSGHPAGLALGNPE